MNINALGIDQLSSPHIPFSASSSLPERGIDAENSFSELLRRTRNTPAEGASSLSPQSPARDERLYEACVELETFLIKNLIKSMRDTVQKTNLIDTGLAGEIYEDMLYDEYAGKVSRSAGFGLAEMAYRELSGQR